MIVLTFYSNVNKKSLLFSFFHNVLIIIIVSLNHVLPSVYTLFCVIIELYQVMPGAEMS